MKRFVIILLLSFCFGCQAEEGSAGWPETFTIGAFAGDDATATIEDNEPLRAYLEEQLGIPVDVVTATSYSAVVEAMKSGRVDAMRIGSASFVLAEQEAGAIPVATYVIDTNEIGRYDPTINPFYVSLFVTKKGNGVATLDDLAGKDVAFVDLASTSGRLAPLVRLMAHNADLNTPEEVDSWLNPLFAGSHNAAVTALINDQVVAATTFGGAYTAVAEQGLADVCGYDEFSGNGMLTDEQMQSIYDACPDGHLVIFDQTDLIPNPPFAVSPDLPETLHTAVQDALLATADNPDFIQAYGAYFIAPEERLDGVESISAFYDVVREISKIAIEE